MIDILTELAPNFRSAVLAREVFLPVDIERVYGITGWSDLPHRADAGPGAVEQADPRLQRTQRHRSPGFISVARARILAAM